MGTVNIAGIDKAKLLQALHAGSRSFGYGALHDNGPLSLEECQSIIEGARGGPLDGTSRDMLGNPLFFDYVRGRVIKADLSKDEFDSWCYDQDNGDGAAQLIVDTLRQKL